MDPFASKKPSKDGKWEFPKDVSFPMDVRVLLKLYKVAENEVGGTHTKYLNTHRLKMPRQNSCRFMHISVVDCRFTTSVVDVDLL